MPLDARKTQHILQSIAQSFAGRQSTIVLVALVSGSYTYTAIQAIMRPLQVPDPQLYDTSSLSTPRSVDTLLIAPIGTNFTGVVYVANTASATAVAVAAAAKYEVVEVVPVGMLPGGSHLRVQLRRLR